MPNINNNNTLSSQAMSVLVGVILIIGPWFVPINFFAKLARSVIGIVLIILGNSG